MGGPRLRMRFEVYEQDASEHGVRGFPLLAGGVTAPDAGGTDAGRTSTWKPTRKLDGGEHVWRSRVESDGKALTHWSAWQMFTVDTTLPRVHECRVGAATIRIAAWFAEDEGTSLAAALDDLVYQDRLGPLINRIEARYPKAYSGAAMAFDGKPSYLGFAGAVPAGAKRLIAEFRARRLRSTRRCASRTTRATTTRNFRSGRARSTTPRPGSTSSTVRPATQISRLGS